MRQYLSNLKWEMVVYSLAIIIFGVLMAIYPAQVMKGVCIVLAVILFSLAGKCLLEYKRNKDIKNFYQYQLVAGIILIVLGIIVLTHMDAILSMITYVIAIIILVSGLMKVENALDLKRMGSHWIPLLVFAIICILLGISVLMMPMNHNDNGSKTAGDFLVQSAGIILAVTAFIDLIATLLVSSKIAIWSKEQKGIVNEFFDMDDDLDNDQEV